MLGDECSYQQVWESTREKKKEGQREGERGTVVTLFTTVLFLDQVCRNCFVVSSSPLELLALRMFILSCLRPYLCRSINVALVNCRECHTASDNSKHVCQMAQHSLFGGRNVPMRTDQSHPHPIAWKTGYSIHCSDELLAMVCGAA